MKADFFSMRVFLYHHLTYLQRKRGVTAGRSQHCHPSSAPQGSRAHQINPPRGAGPRQCPLIPLLTNGLH